MDKHKIFDQVCDAIRAHSKYIPERKFKNILF